MTSTNDNIINDDKIEKQPKKRKINKLNIENSEHDTKYTTPIKASINIDYTTKKVENNDDMLDIFSIFDNLSENIKNDSNSSPYIGKQTIVDVCKIFSTSIEGSALIGFIVSNFYGGRRYINDTIWKASQLLYPKNVDQLCSDLTNIPNNSDVAYLYNKNNRPCVLISSMPKIMNKFYIESMNETLTKLINQHQGSKPDPENSGKVFSFNYLPDFHLNTLQKKNHLHLFAVK